MDFGTLQSRISAKTGNYAGFTTQQIKDAINDSIFEICKKFNVFPNYKDANISVVANTRTYNLPSDFRSEEYLALVSNDALIKPPLVKSYKERLHQFDRQDYLSDSIKGQPKFYIINDNTISLYPLPDTSYTLKLFYKFFFATLVQSTDRNYLTDKHPFPIIYYALSLLYDDVGTDEQVGKYRMLYNQAEREMLIYERYREEHQTVQDNQFYLPNINPLKW